ncbi:MAG TPA: molybdopterin cofactor-binding domain-containing protein [Streptosporangiaceae bacterium]|nr:molybdopterin cofactor-binding domain-containing protein [Streptosporangiaceae bacterium]
MTVTLPRTAGVRADARAKATGATRYSADVGIEGALHAAVVRSPFPRASISGILADEAQALTGVAGVVTAADLTAARCGRRVRDMPLLADGVVRFSGEPVAVVLATTRLAAEEAAALVEVGYDELPPVLDPVAALAQSAPRVHEAPWEYAGAVVSRGAPANLQSELIEGSLEAADAALARAAHVVAATYRTPAGHQGYLEPCCWTAMPAPPGGVVLQGTAKAPYRLREQVAETLGIDVEAVRVEPTPIGGDFGGKGGVVDPTLCAALALWARRPVRMMLRSDEDLTATDARHSAVIDVRVGCDEDARLVALVIDAVLDGGAYAAVKPIPSVNLHGMAEAALGYRLEAYAVRSRIAYTNRVPKGHMRAPGAPQAVFAIESAIDELARKAGVAPAELRRRSLLRDGDRDAYGHAWEEARGPQTLDAALSVDAHVPVPAGWHGGTGLAVYARPTAAPASTSLRLRPATDGSLVVEVPFPETGTGSHTLVGEQMAAALDVEADRVRVEQVSTARLPYDPGVGASRVTVGLTNAVHRLAVAWRESAGDGPLTVFTDPGDDHPALSYCAQVARVAVDPSTGQVRVLELIIAVDVAAILRPRSHQLQLEGGAVMGFGFACLEDLLEEEGQVWAANLAEFRLPTAADVPELRTVLLEGGRGVGPANVKAVGELANVPVAAAIANAVADAVGARIRQLPVTAERVYWAMSREGAS